MEFGINARAMVMAAAMAAAGCGVIPLPIGGGIDGIDTAFDGPGAELAGRPECSGQIRPPDGPAARIWVAWEISCQGGPPANRLHDETVARILDRLDLAGVSAVGQDFDGPNRRERRGGSTTGSIPSQER